MPGVFLLARDTAGGNIAIPEDPIGARAGLAQRDWRLIV
jgi:hypothetical protein